MSGPDRPDPRLWNVDPGALGGPPSSPVSLSSPAIEHILIQTAAVTSPFGRKLSPDEVKLIRSIFADSVDANRIRVVEASIANAPTTLGNQIRVQTGKAFASETGKAILIHEAAHVWQYQTQGTRYITCAVYHQVEAHVRTGTRNAAYMNYKLDSRRKISDYPAEEQAQIIEDYYQIAVRYKNSLSPPDWVSMRRKHLADYERLISQVRGYRPKTQNQIYSDSVMKDPRGRFAPPQPRGENQTLPLVPILEYRFNMPWDKK